MKDWFHTSDLHGQGALYEQLVGIVASRRPPVVVIGGDLCPHATGAAGIAQQRVFLQGTLVETARRLREASPATRLLLLMVNDDWAANLDCLEQHHGDLWEHVHDRVVEAAAHLAGPAAQNSRVRNRILQYEWESFLRGVLSWYAKKMG